MTKRHSTADVRYRADFVRLYEVLAVTAALADFALVRQSRLSVVPVSKGEWKVMCKMAGIKA